MTTDRHEHLVLLVDDQEEARDALAMLLRNEGFAVREARDGQEALDALYDGPRPCLVVLDLMMPGMDGFEFLDEMRTRDSLQSVPIIVITGKDVTAEDRSRLNGHVVRVVQKPGDGCSALLPEISRLVRAAARLAEAA